MKKYIIGFVLVLMILLIAFLSVKSWWQGNPKYRFGKDRTAVITQVQSLAKLETASYSVDKIIEVGTDFNPVKEFLFGDKLVLVAHGKVVAGYDLSKIKAEDFSGFGSDITINLPEPEIFDTILDNSQTRVFDRDQGLFTKGELDLEAEGRQEAESAIREAACEGGILSEAALNAETQLKIIFKSAGFENIVIISPEGDCS